MSEITYKVTGMTCGGCVRGLTTALERAGLKATVDLETATATVEGEHQPSAVKDAVEAAGFDYEGPTAG